MTSDHSETIRAIHRYLSEQAWSFDAFEVRHAGVNVRGKASLNGHSSEFAFDAWTMQAAKFAGSDAIQVCMDTLHRSLTEAGVATLRSPAADPRVVIGADLDAAAEAQGVFRGPSETDESLRARLITCIERDRAMMDPNGVPK